MRSLNESIELEKLELIITELEERTEFGCALQACGANFEGCLGVACLLACIGIGPCLIGIHAI